MKGRPKVDVGVVVLNSSSEKILLGLHKAENKWKIPSGKLLYSENFSDCAEREIKNKLSISVEPYRFKRSVSFNVLDKPKNLHSIEIDFLVKLTKKEETLVRNPRLSEFDWWVWFDYSELIEEMPRFSLALNILFSKFKVSSISALSSVFSQIN